MKVTKEQSQQNRQALLDAAAVMFKQHGIDGVGVADVCRQAGLTHGALYKHFTDKQDLAAQAFGQAFRTGHARMGTTEGGEAPSLARYLDAYLSRRTRDDLTLGCPLVSTACETARQGAQVSQGFTDAFVALRAGIRDTLPDDERQIDRDAVASLVVAALMGAMAISRGVAKTDRALADEVLGHVHQVLGSLSVPPKAP
ncbi:TetR/AcrR family transcriptional regulator [Piscinibacter gummiphilus]|uniref:Uncharacterized protein n=1 Tax=Piscinibacter gummiphilus TaxID=946333 RepID=A0A1W6L9B1_9BURK|nr:TetR/AcrR family transcriptional regulator [Piscinibacter gummiphilus]ARN20895.1 hypothetical protein A4W93_13865 [Piscinibacter gummiphilus]ATU65571.1 TetR/AcrR family transcriptional regulator [Piscinibacter gummiphilus]GLS94737.1 TetR family transcriptional regulator [Piscinibacter gummiphilus]